MWVGLVKEAAQTNYKFQTITSIYDILFSFELAELFQGFNSIFRYVLRIFWVLLFQQFHNFFFCSWSESFLRCLWHSFVDKLSNLKISLLAVQTGMQCRAGSFKSIKFFQSGDQKFTHHRLLTCSLELPYITNIRTNGHQFQLAREQLVVDRKPGCEANHLIADCNLCQSDQSELCISS